jgi:predicted DsbA family dithiol-disulfide isomerase
VEPVRLIVYSDYLCPWCYNASVRMERLERELGDRVCVEWRSYLLRPNASERRDPDAFRAYTRSWQRPAAEEDAGEFRTWAGEAAPPSHSVPAHRAAKAAAELGEDAFRRMHRRLLHAYFAEGRDVSDPATLRALWGEVGLPDAGFARSQEILDEHNEALSLGATGVPAVRLGDGDVCIVGAHPVELYRRWVLRTLASRGEPAA